MSNVDAATISLAGHTIWAVAKWLEAHYDGEPYEISSDTERVGYRLTVERIAYHA